MISDLFSSPETLASPFEFFKELRDEAPVYFSQRLQAFVVTRYADVQYVLRTPGLFSSYPAGANANTSSAFAPEYAAIYEELGTYPPLPTLVITDGDVHRRYRAVASGPFSPTSVRGMEGKLLELVNMLIDEFIDSEKCDLYADLCLKLPSFAMCDILGVPREAAPVLKRGADTSPRLQSGALETESTRRELHRHRAEMYVLIQEYISKYRKNPSDNVISHLLQTPPMDGVPLNERELVSLVATLNVGGNETTVNGLGNMFYVALTSPGMMSHIREHPEDIALLIEESLRLESAVSALPRRVVVDTEIRGVRLPAESRVFVDYASANRDERWFECPDVAQLSRPKLRTHVGFGMGAHFCLGAPLARLQMRLAMKTVIERLHNLELDPGAPAIRHQQKLVVRGVTALPVKFVRHAGRCREQSA